MSENRDGEVKKYLSDILDNIIKLNREVSNLRVDVVNLSKRIEPFEGEKDFKYIDESFFQETRPRDFQQCLELIRTVRAAVREAEGYTRFAASRMEGISADAISREEMKPWLKSNKRNEQE
ncbi:MAG: hypothetical protein JJ902_06515 [Roseibium sp.]|nr:hypothetical protein [Roseibium sp.]